MKPDTRAMLAKEFREQGPMALFWLAFMLFAPVASTGLFLAGQLLGRVDSSWAEFLVESGAWTPGRYRDLALHWAVFAWGGIRVFHRETLAGTHAWLRTMPVPEFVIAGTKTLAAGAYVVAATSALLIVQVAAVVAAGLHETSEGVLWSLVQSWLGVTAAMFFAYALGAYVGAFWRPRSVVRAAVIFAASTSLMLITVLLLELPGDRAPSFDEVSVPIGPRDAFDWTNRALMYFAWGIVWLAGLGWDFGRRPVIRHRS